MSDTAFGEIYLDFANSCDTHCPYIIVKYSCIVNLDLTFVIVLTNYMCSDGSFKSLCIYLLSHFYGTFTQRRVIYEARDKSFYTDVYKCPAR